VTSLLVPGTRIDFTWPAGNFLNWCFICGNAADESSLQPGRGLSFPGKTRSAQYRNRNEDSGKLAHLMPSFLNRTTKLCNSQGAVQFTLFRHNRADGGYWLRNAVILFLIIFLWTPRYLQRNI
jgi:hypothetical protein